MTNKKFRELLNATEHKDCPHRNPRWGNRKRAYGDYLYYQDRDMFNDVKRRYEQAAEKETKIKEDIYDKE